MKRYPSRFYLLALMIPITTVTFASKGQGTIVDVPTKDQITIIDDQGMVIIATNNTKLTMSQGLEVTIQEEKQAKEEQEQKWEVTGIVLN